MIREMAETVCFSQLIPYWCVLFFFFLFSSKGQWNFVLHKFYWLYSLQPGLWGRCWDSGHCQCQKVRRNPPPMWVGIMVTQLMRDLTELNSLKKYTLGLWWPSTWEHTWLMTWSLGAWLRAARIYIYHLGLLQCLLSHGLGTTTAVHNGTVSVEGSCD